MDSTKTQFGQWIPQRPILGSGISELSFKKVSPFQGSNLHQSNERRPRDEASNDDGCHSKQQE